MKIQNHSAFRAAKLRTRNKTNQSQLEAIKS
jgi:hypothetical protein